MNQNEELSNLDEETPQLSQLSILPNNESDDESSQSSMASLTTAQRTRGKERIFVLDTTLDTKKEAVDIIT